MTEILQLLLFGIVLGSIITLGAIGVSLIFGILRFAHFAHGDMMTAGAYFAFFFVTVFGCSIWAALPFAVAGTILLALCFDQIVYKPLRRTRPVILLIASIGVSLIPQHLVQIIWGPDNVVYEPGIKLPVHFLGLRMKQDQIFIVLGAVALVVFLRLFLQRTKVGKAMRAMSDDPDLARVTGIDTERVIVWTWVIGGGMACAAGIFLGLDTRLQPTMGWHLLLPIFAATILGGIGNPYGAIAGGMVVGITSEMSTLIILPSYKPAIAFALMVIMLIVRPTGLFKENR
jgi:branched-chain amino acid transport system permease protein/neutral amino acid transport system permease protein